MRPLTDVPRTINVSVAAVAVSAVVQPLADVNVAIRVDKSTITCGLTSLEKAFIAASINPNVLAKSFSNLRASDPLTLIFGTVF